MGRLGKQLQLKQARKAIFCFFGFIVLRDIMYGLAKCLAGLINQIIHHIRACFKVIERCRKRLIFEHTGR